MESTALRRLVAVAIALLLVHQVGSGIAAFFGGFWGGLAALAVAAVCLAGLRLAGSGSGAAWFLVPAVAFAVVPPAVKIWAALGDKDATWAQQLAAVVPVLVGFVLPVALLLVVYVALRRKPQLNT